MLRRRPPAETDFLEPVAVSKRLWAVAARETAPHEKEGTSFEVPSVVLLVVFVHEGVVQGIGEDVEGDLLDGRAGFVGEGLFGDFAVFFAQFVETVRIGGDQAFHFQHDGIVGGDDVVIAVFAAPFVVAASATAVLWP